MEVPEFFQTFLREQFEPLQAGLLELQELQAEHMGPLLAQELCAGIVAVYRTSSEHGFRHISQL